MNNVLVLIDYDNGMLSRFVGRECTDALQFVPAYPIPAEDVEMFRVFPADFKEMIGAAE